MHRASLTLMEANRLAGLYMAILVFAAVYFILLLFFPKRLDPLPLLPLCLLVLAVQAGIRIAAVNYLFVYEMHDVPMSFWPWWEEYATPPKYLLWVFTALIGHGMIHWAIALHRSFKRWKHLLINGIAHACVIACILIAGHVAYAVFDATYLNDYRYFKDFNSPRSLYVNWPDAPHPREKWFRMLFVEVEYEPYIL